MATATLEKINSPANVKALSSAGLTELSSSIREEIIRVTARNGGHLATNLGSVDLTIALHHVFDSPHDKFIWDVGNQCYAHKILTGRRDRFPTIRKPGGLSGFANRKESPHDPLTSGHSGTALSTALGLAAARDRLDEDYSVVTIVGDGALTAGLAYEALNNLATLRSQFLVIINDNEYSISPSRGALPAALRRCKSRILDGGVFEQLGLTYWGPVDGHDIALLIDVLREARKHCTPIVLHTLTTKGKGYKPAECDPSKYHGVGPFDIVTGKTTKKDQEAPTYSEVFGEEMIRIAQADHRVVAITAAMAEGTGLAEFARKFADRFFDVGIAEQHAVTFGAGLALGGTRPVVAIYSSFLQRGFDGVIHDVCLQDLPVTLVLDRAGLVGDDGPTHHGVLDFAYLRSIPRMTVAAPKDGGEFRAMLQWAISHPAPVAIRVPRGAVPEPIATDRQPMPIRSGSAELLREGKDVALLAIGSMVRPAFEAAEELDANGISCAVVNARFVKPLDEALLLDLAKSVDHIFTIEEHMIHGGFGSAVLEFLSANGVTTPTTVLALPDTFIEHGKREHMLDEAGLTAPRIVQRVLDATARGRSTAHGTIDVPDRLTLRREIDAIAQRRLPEELETWAQKYASVGHRKHFLWQWCLKGVELTSLPCVAPELWHLNNETKVMGVMLDVLLDDVADNAKDERFLEILLAITSDGAGTDLDSLAPERRQYAELTASVWQAIFRRAGDYPRFREFERILRFDYLQLFNAMRYSNLINRTPHAMNLAEHDLYLPHNMHMMISGTLDLMCSPSFDIGELGTIRTLLWNAQCMGRVGNLITTWERELLEGDFTSGVFARAIEERCLTADDLLQGDPEEIKCGIRKHGCEKYFLRRWNGYRRHIRAMSDTIRSFDVMVFLQGLEKLLGIHLGSRGMK